MAVARVEETSLWLGTRQVHYSVRRTARKTYSLNVDGRGVRVGAPLRASRREVEAFVREHGDWLLDRMKDVAAQEARTTFVIEDGAKLPFRGGELRLRLEEVEGIRRAVARWQEVADGGETLQITIWPSAGPALAELLVKALRQKALPLLTARVAVYCAALGLAPPPVRLTAATTRWGSCSSRTGIRLHWRLIHLPDAISDYVVAHEVAHLVEMNHSSRFWQIVERLYPDWRTARATLRALGCNLPVITAADHAAPASE